MACDPDQKPTANADLTVNGKKIELNRFVESFISQTVIGMVKPLKGVNDIKTIDLNISTNSEKPQVQ